MSSSKKKSKGNKSTTSGRKRPHEEDADILEVQLDVNTIRQTRRNNVPIKNEREDIQAGFRNCPVCRASGLWQDGCKTVTCTRIDRHDGRYVRFCIFCKKLCAEMQLSARASCSCPDYNGPDERRACYEQSLKPVDLMNDDDEFGEGAQITNEDGDTSTTPPGDEGYSSGGEYHQNKKRRLHSDEESWHAESESDSDYQDDESIQEQSSNVNDKMEESAAHQSTVPDEVKNQYSIGKVKDVKSANLKEEEVSTDEEGSWKPAQVRIKQGDDMKVETDYEGEMVSMII